MKLFHHSHDTFYRNPFGAVKTGQEITLRLLASETPKAVWVRLFCPEGETRIDMTLEKKTDTGFLYQATIQAGETPCLLWYDFVAEGEELCYYSNSGDALGGVGTMTDFPAGNSYQITVYDKDYHAPVWFRDQIMYQIFPDRFFGVHDGEVPKKREEYIIHPSWSDPLAFNRHPYEDGPACNDFYGGNLRGIRAKLPYLREMGVSVIYLNPIFEAYSNHRYDTGDYKNIDPILGDIQDFEELCNEAERYGIRIILDGVFSHTGADSIYFNKYGCYGQGQGAFQNPDSPYRNWYQFGNYPDYQSWWGCSNLPNVNEMEESYLDYILRDEDAVIKKWIRHGAAGWRLDVADELPDEFIQILRKELKRENPEAVLIGEVWEDASNKIAYSKQREYLLGKELDSVMNYPFRDQALAFLMGHIDATEMNHRFLSQMENYPVEILYSLMNMLGTHDTMRVKSLLGGMGADCGDARLDSQREELATKRLMLGSFLQMTFYGVPCIYYGDEAGMQGGKDPFNRGTYPWRAVDPELRSWYCRLGQLRREMGCLRCGYFKPLYAKGGVYIYTRYFEDGKDPFGEMGDGSMALCLVNRDESPADVTLVLPEVLQTTMKDVFSKEEVTFAEGEIALHLPPLSARIFVGNGENVRENKNIKKMKKST